MLKAIILFVAFQLLSACGGSGYNRSYIVSDAVDTEVVSESPDPR